MSTEANVKLLEKIGKGGKDTSKLKVPTTRLTDNFRDILLESGFDKKATVKDVKAGYATKTGQKIGSFTAFNNYLGKINPNLTVFSNDPRTMIKVTNELNKVRSDLGLPKYTNVGITTPRSVLEQTTTGTKYAEAGSKIPKEKVQKTLLEAQLKADKEFGVTPDGKAPTKKKLNFMAKYIQGKLGKTLTLSGIISLITKSGFGKMIPGVNVLSTAYDVGTIGKEVGPDVIEKVQEGLDTVTEPVASKMAQAEDMIKQMFLSKMNEGGMMDINYMTRPLGYKDGTREGTTVGDLENRIGQLNKTETDMLTGPMATEKNTMANMGSIMTQEDLKGLKNLIDSEVYAGFMRQGDKRGPGDVDAFKIAKDFLVGKGIASDSPQFDALINPMMNLLNRDLIPQAQMELEKESRPGILNLLDKVLGGSKDQEMLEGFRKLRE